jgi:hypothetical protein
VVYSVFVTKDVDPVVSGVDAEGGVASGKPLDIEAGTVGLSRFPELAEGTTCTVDSGIVELSLGV